METEVGLFVKNNDPLLEKHWVELKSKNVYLYELMLALGKHIKKTYNKSTIMTDIYRTKEQQERIYGKGTKKVSPHMLWHAVDIRSSIFTKEEIEDIVKWINTNYNSRNHYKFTAMYHEVKNFGLHFHIQYVRVL